MPETDPLRTGYMIKQGAVVKNWKKRFFVARPDYFIEYYENQEVSLARNIIIILIIINYINHLISL